MIARNGDLALLLLDRIGLARDIDQDEVTLNKTEVDLAALVRESVADLEVVLLSDHPTEVSAPEPVALRADPTAAREIVFTCSRTPPSTAPKEPGSRWWSTPKARPPVSWSATTAGV